MLEVRFFICWHDWSIGVSLHFDAWSVALTARFFCFGVTVEI